MLFPMKGAKNETFKKKIQNADLIMQFLGLYQ